MTTPEERLVELGLELPPPPKPVASYVPVIRAGDLLFVSGQGPIREGAPLATGKVGAAVTLEAAQEAARLTCLNGLSAIRDEVGELSRVSRMVKLTVFVASAPGFTRQPLVANGASDLLLEVFGPTGRHARSAVGVSELPFDMPVEIDFVAEVG